MSKNASQHPPRTGQSAGQKLHQTLLLLLLALLSVTAATYAWFSLSASTRVRSMNLEITSGVALRFDTSAHASFDDYVKTLPIRSIYDQLRTSFGYDAEKNELQPLTSTDGVHFQTEKGVSVAPKTGQYLEFTLHFMASKDMTVHLTSAHTEGKEDGTLVESKTGADAALRISFTGADGTAIYQPRGESAGTFTLATATKMQYNDKNALFSLKADTDFPVTVRVWLEGTDPACTNELRGADYSIRLRFAGTDAAGQPLE